MIKLIPIVLVQLYLIPIASQTVHQPSAGTSRTDVPRELLRFGNHDIPLTVPAVQDHSCRRINGSGYPIFNRKSRSLRILMNNTQDVWNPVRQTLSLQTLTQLSYMIKGHAQSDDSINTRSFASSNSLSDTEGSTNEMYMEELYSRVQKYKGVCNNEHDTGARSLIQNNFRPVTYDQQPHEDYYSTINEARLSEYHCIKTNEHGENLQEGQINTAAGNNDYDYATLPAF